MRVENSAKNFGMSITLFVTNVLINFLARSIFINILGADYLGLNGLFTNIVSVLSIAELGFGSVIIYSMYKPVAENDYEKIKSLLGLYKKIYVICGMVVLAVGLAIIPFLNYLIVDAGGIHENLYVIYLLFLLNSVIGYFTAYKRCVVNVYQKKRIETLNTLIFYVLLNLLQIIILYLTKNYILYLAIKPVLTLTENISISVVANKLYPFIREKAVPLTKEEKKPIYKNTLAMMSHKIGGVVLSGTDSIVISAFLGLAIVGYYSNYLLITTALTTFFGIYTSSLASSVGNAIASESKETVYKIFRKTTFAHFWLLCFCATCLLCLFQPFISLWIGREEYLLSFETVIVIVANFYVYTSRHAIHIYKDGAGLFWNDRWKPVVEVILNIGISILLAQYLGIMGVILGTLISSVVASLWLEPFILYKNYFKKSVKNYYLLYLFYAFITFISCVAAYFSTVYLPNTFWFFLLRIVICLIIPNVLFICVFFRTEEFKYYKRMFCEISAKLLRKIKRIHSEDLAEGQGNQTEDNVLKKDDSKDEETEKPNDGDEKNYNSDKREE